MGDAMKSVLVTFAFFLILSCRSDAAERNSLTASSVGRAPASGTFGCYFSAAPTKNDGYANVTAKTEQNIKAACDTNKPFSTYYSDKETIATICCTGKP
jgi:hypothetical protein